MKKKVVGIFVCMLVLTAAALPVAGIVNNVEDEEVEQLVDSGLDEIYKWEQKPDTSWYGVDVRCDRNDGIQRKLADDFECTITGPITDVHLWGSWRYDEGEMEMIHLSIHEDIPANESPTNYSMPGKMLWEGDFTDFNESIYFHQPDGEWFWDPYTGYLAQDHNNIWQYDIYIPETAAFEQTGTPDEPVIYWLDVWVITRFGEFGWKSSKEHWNDDGVFWVEDDPFWKELRYPPGHPYHGESMDLAFAITTEEEPEECCLAIESMVGGLFASTASLKINSVIKNIGGAECKDIRWKYTTTGGIVIWGTKSGTVASLLPGDTVTVTSRIFIGLAIPGIFPGNVTIEADATNNACPPATMTKGLFLFIFLLQLV